MMRVISISILLLSLFGHMVHGNGQKIRGVNVGGWLLLERYMTPSIFQIDPSVQDEWTLGEHGNSAIRSAQQRHWQAWFTRDDAVAMRNADINVLRIPFGYWSILSQEELNRYQEPFVLGAWQYLEAAMVWLKELQLKVVLDLHALPGAQNPWIHSGRLDSLHWGTGDTVNRSLDILDRVSQIIQKWQSDPLRSDTVVGLEVANEIWVWQVHGGIGTVKQYYLDGYEVVRKRLPAPFWYVIEMAFVIEDWIGFMNDSAKYQSVVLDMHLYQVFTKDFLAMSRESHLALACSWHRNSVAQQTLPVFVGEWSVAWKVAGDFADTEPFPTADEQSFMRKFFLAQTCAFETSLGWMFWGWKTETAPMWDYSKGLQNGWIPSNVEQASYNISSGCSFEGAPPTPSPITVPQSIAWPYEKNSSVYSNSSSQSTSASPTTPPVATTSAPASRTVSATHQDHETSGETTSPTPTTTSPPLPPPPPPSSEAVTSESTAAPSPSLTVQSSSGAVRRRELFEASSYLVLVLSLTMISFASAVLVG